MLGYRAFFAVGDAHGLIRLAEEQLDAWLRAKGLDPDVLLPGGYHALGRGATGTTLPHTSADGSRTVRTQVVEEKHPGHRWTTELTVHRAEEDGESWVWLDVLAPDAATTTRTPRLAGALLDVLDARDGGVRLGAQPHRLVGPGEVDALVDALAGGERRGLAFVSAVPPTIDLATWHGHVATLLRQSRGLASGYVLDAEATALFAATAGVEHAVAPGTVRTFHPAAVLGDRADGLRHRVLSAARIAHSSDVALASMLGRRAGEQARTAPLPESARQLDRVLRDAWDERLVAKARPPRRPSPLGGPGTDAAAPVERRAASEQETRQALSELMASVSGEKHVTHGAVEALAALVSARREESASAPGQDAAIDQLQARIADLEQGIDRESALRQEAVKRAEDEQVERAIAEQDRAGAERRLRFVQQRFADVDADGALWAEPEPEPADVAPASLEELLARLRASELDHVVFTGDEALTLGLDEHDLAGTAARKAWEAILALNDYAARSLAGLCPSDVDGYLQQTPAGCRGFSAARHARGESEDVRRNRRYAGARVLPVPREVDPSGSAEMWAHFKLTQSGMTSPRLHYHDATATTGTVYVGYLGPHLPNGATN